MPKPEEKDQDLEKPQDSSADQKPAEHMIPKSRLDEVIAQRNTANERLTALEEKLEAAEKKRLEENEQFKELYEKAQDKLNQLQPVADKVTDAEAILQANLDAQIAELPEGRRDLVPTDLPVEKQLEWLTKNRTLLMKPIAPEIGAGKKGGDGGKDIELTTEQLMFAAKLGLKPEEYAKNLKR